MKHLFICREYPPAPYPPGGIGTYVKHICRLLAESGDHVHVIAQRWEGAPSAIAHDGKIVVHRVSPDDPVPPNFQDARHNSLIINSLTRGDCPCQAFSWQVAAVTEHLIVSEGIDVIEAPEWEAPLYYYQLRRSLGLGPAKQPPCIIHLHSPSELIFHHNQWDVTLSDYEPLRQCERYTVQAAHKVLCPSSFLARQSEAMFGLETGQVRVIPYPLGDSGGIDRPAAVWRRDSVCFTGRLELRKGVVEWVDAAVKVAQSHPTVSFDFIGSDTSFDGGPGASVRRFLWDRIPSAVRPRFHFHGSMSREKLREALAGTAIAVVPSRWENLPYSCIEAMSSGLPVLVSPHGGMRELIEDGESGWIAADATPAALASALRTALETLPDRRAEMGRNAAAAVSRHCSNQTVLEHHLELRRRLVERMADKPAATVSVAAPARCGMGLVVSFGDRMDLLRECMENMVRQTQVAAHVVAIGSSQALELCRTLGVGFVDRENSLAREAALQQILEAAPYVCGIAFVEAGVQLEPHCLGTLESVLDRRPEVATVSGFIGYRNQTADLDVKPGLDWQTLEASRDCLCLAVRAEFLQHRRSGPLEWAHVTYPGILAFAPVRKTARASAQKRYSAIALAQRTSSKLMWTWFLGAPVAEKIRWVGRVLLQPRRAAQWLSWQLRTASARTR